MGITMFQLEGTKWICECRPFPRDIVIWNGDRVIKIIQGETGQERLNKAKEWLEKHVKGYSVDKMVRIRQYPL